MSFMSFTGNIIKKVDKPGKGYEITLFVPFENLEGHQLATFPKLYECDVRMEFEPLVVRYNVQVNAKTDKPIKSYKVDEQGIVSEVKPEGEQVEMDLDIPMAKDQIKDVPEEISREVVDEFILSGLAPRFEGLWYPVQEWIERLAEGDTYLRLANEARISSGKIVDIIDDYRQRVAPLAAKWDDWRQNGQPASQDSEDEEQEEQEQGDLGSDDLPPATDQEEEPKLQQPGEINFEDEGLEGKAAAQGLIDDWEAEVKGEGKPGSSIQPNPEEAEDLDAYILRERPLFEDIPYDFPTLLERQRAGETWREIAEELGTVGTTLSSAWNKYKKRVKDQRANGAA